MDCEGFRYRDIGDCDEREREKWNKAAIGMSMKYGKDEKETKDFVVDFHINVFPCTGANAE